MFLNQTYIMLVCFTSTFITKQRWCDRQRDRRQHTEHILQRRPTHLVFVSDGYQTSTLEDHKTSVSHKTWHVSPAEVLRLFVIYNNNFKNNNFILATSRLGLWMLACSTAADWQPLNCMVSMLTTLLLQHRLLNFLIRPNKYQREKNRIISMKETR